MKEKEIISHIHPKKEPERLEEHKLLVNKYLKRIIEKKGINLEKLIDIFKIKDREFVKEVLINAVIMHDEGKINPAFQYLKMKNNSFKEEFEKLKIKNSKHSFLSAKIFFKKYIKKIMEKINIEEYEELNKKLFLIVALSFLISKHHSKIEEFEKFIEVLKNELKKEDFEWAEFNLYRIDNINDNIKEFITLKFIYSLLISSDYYATFEYMFDLEIEDFGDIDLKKRINEFEEYEIIKNIRKGIYKKEIDKLRNEMFLEAEKNLNINKNIFYLKAPTGAGKSLISLNLALKLNPKKIFYIFPFNTLVEQTENRISEIFKTLKYSVINSITPIKDEEEDKLQYEKTYLNRLFYHYELILTTHVNFFDILFGTNKESNFALWQLYGSVIILDEIQSYDNNLWWYMVEFFNVYAEILNLKIIIMSATLPKIDKLLENKNNFLELIDSKKYFTHPLFKDRVKINFSMLDKEEISFDDIRKKILEGEKVLVEFIKKKRAREFYDYIKDLEGYEVYELDGDDNKIFREKVIKRSKEAKKIVIVSTQVIEAGVDIDMDLGLKDISAFDSDEQFLGRINRNALKKSVVYFFDLDNEEDVYKKDNRLGINLKNETIRKFFLEKNFDKCYEIVLNRLEDKKNRFDGIFTKKIEFFEMIKNLNYENIYKKMRLIKYKSITLFFPFEIEIYDKKINGNEIWEKLKSLNNIKSFAKKEIERTKLNFYLQFFTFNIPYIDNLSKFNDECCGIYLIEDYKDFIDDDFKFNREKFLKYQNKKYDFL